MNQPLQGNRLQIVIVGAGGFGREILAWLWDCYSPEKYEVKGFLGRTDDESPRDHGVDLDVLGDPETYVPAPEDRLLLAIGNVAVRRRVVESLQSRGGQFLTMIHPTAVVASSAKIGQGVVLYPFSLVANRAVLEDFVLLNNYASASHDAFIGRYSNLCPYAMLTGAAVIEDEVFMATHTMVAPGRRVGRGSTVSANTCVLRDVPPRSFVFGVPGKIVQQPQTGSSADAPS